MALRLAADAVLLAHLAFIAFVIGGGLLVRRWPWVATVHLPAAVWGFLIEGTGGLCPLTTIENHFRRRAGLAGYDTSFVEHYLLDVIYPSGLTRGAQLVLAALVIAINAAIYAWVLHRRRVARVAR